MLKDLTELDKHFILEITRDSLSRGEEVRRNGINKLTVVSVNNCLFCWNKSCFFVALGFFAATYPVVYAIYSVSASLNIQLDLVTRLLVHVVATDIETDGKNK